MEMILPLILRETNSGYWRVREGAIEVLDKLIQAMPERVSEILPTLFEAMKDRDWEVRKAAVTVLGIVVQVVPDEVSEIFLVLWKAMDNKNEGVRKAIVTTLGVVGGMLRNEKEIFPMLLEAMKDRDRDIRKAAIIALGVVVQVVPDKVSEILPVLWKAVDDENDSVRNAALTALGVMVQGVPDKVSEILPMLLGAMKDRGWQVQEAAVTALDIVVQVAPDKVSEILPALWEAMKNTDWWVRKAAVSALGVVAQGVPDKVKEILPTLLEAMKDRDWQVRKAAVSALGVVAQGVPDKVKEILPTLLEAMKDRDWQVRKAAVSALGVVAQGVPDKARETLPALLEAMKDTDQQVRKAAVTALSAVVLGKESEILPEVWEAMEDRDLQAQKAAVRGWDVVVQAMPEKVSEILPVLLEAMKDRDWQVRKAAVTALGVVVREVPNKVIEILPALLKAMDNKNEDVQKAGVIALCVMVQVAPDKVSEILPVLWKAMKDTDWQVPTGNKTLGAVVQMAPAKEGEILPALGVLAQAPPEKASEVLFPLLNAMSSNSEVAVNLLGKVLQGIFNKQLALLVNFLINLYLESLDISFNSHTIKVKEVVSKMIQTLMQSPHTFPQHAELWSMFRSSDATLEEYEMAYILLSCMAIYTKIDFDQQYADLTQSSAMVSAAIQKDSLLFSSTHYLSSPLKDFDIDTEQQVEQPLISSNTLAIQQTPLQITLINPHADLISIDKKVSFIPESNDNQQTSSASPSHQKDQIFIDSFIRNVQKTGYLSLKKNLDEAMVVAILNHIITQKIPLQAIWLNHLSATALITIAPLLTKLLTSTPQLQILDLSYNDWGQVSAEIFRNLVNALSHCQLLKELYLNKTGISLDQVRLLSSVLNAFSQLESIQLGNNTLSESGVFVLLEKLPVMNLKDVSLSGNALSIKSWEFLGTWLKTPAFLECLYLSRCQLDAVGLKKLVEGIRLNPKLMLKKLCLDNNLLDDSAFTCLLELIQVQSKLTQIVIWDNPFAPQGITQLQELLKNLSINALLRENVDQFFISYWKVLAQQTQDNNNAIVSENVAIKTASVPEPRLGFFGNSIDIRKEKANNDASVSAENSSIADNQDTLPTLTITQERDEDVPELIDTEEVSEQESYRMR